MSLERIKVKGFKSIRELDFELQSLNVLIGANGAGKSNFINLFQFINEIAKERLGVYSLRQGVDSLLYFGAKTTPQLSFELIFDTEKPKLYNGYHVVLEPTPMGKLMFVDEVISIHNRRYPRPLLYELGTGHDETKLPVRKAIEATRTPAYYVSSALESWIIYHFHDTSEQSPIKKPSHIDDNDALRPDASNLAAFLYRLKETQPEHYQTIVQTVRLVAPFFDDFNLRPRHLNPQEILLEWREKDSDNYFNAHHLSDGTLRFICLATLLLQPNLPSIIIIDEPELGLHPYAINLLAELLYSASEVTQVIVSTQSVPLINQFAPEDVVVVDREDRQSTFKRLSSETLKHWLDVYNLGELWEKNIIGGRPSAG